MTCRPVIGSRQHRTPETVPKAFHEEPGRMFSRDLQNICKIFWFTPMIY